MSSRAEQRSLHETSAPFWKIAGAGALFQAGSSAVDSATIVASLVHQLTGSVYAVGFASAVLRVGWLAPQIVVGHLAQASGRRMPFYAIGGFGRAACIGVVALLLALGRDLPAMWIGAGFLVLWTAYGFVSGIVAVPYNDIVGRSIPSPARSRLLAWRFFGGGVLALGVASLANQLLKSQPVLVAYGYIFALAAVLMAISALSFVSAGEPPVGDERHGQRDTFRAFATAGLGILRTDGRFRHFLYSQWLGGVTVMALPFYVVAAGGVGLAATDVAILLGAQTAGALISNALWGGIGDRLSKLALLRAVGVLRLLVPAGALAIIAIAPGLSPTGLLVAFAVQFVVIGALVNGVTIGYLGYLMEVSPDDRRPAYSAYFNALAAPAALLPLAGAVIADIASLQAVFGVAAVAAVVQLGVYQRLGRLQPAGRPL